jgi:hypothetical protein
MIGTRAGMLILSVALMVAVSSAATAPPSYVSVEESIQKARSGLSKPGGGKYPKAPGWTVFLDALERDMAGYGSAKTDAQRLGALNRLNQMWTALSSVNWAPAAEVREALGTWLRPRMMLAWAERELRDSVHRLPVTADPTVQGNRNRWIEFVDRDLGTGLGEYEAATTVGAKRAGLDKIQAALYAIETSQKSSMWGPGQSLQSALNNLFNRPNLHATADLASLQPRLAHQIVENGPVYRRGNVSQVTAGAYQGFGLLPSDDGIAFYNKQFFSSVTPVNNFQGQIAADQKGKRVAKIYYFNATTTDGGLVTATAILRPSGLQLLSDATHNTNARITSMPTVDHGLGRVFASMLGMNQDKITKKVYEGAIGRIRSEVVQEAKLEAGERLAKAQAEQNARLRPYLPGDGSLVFRNFVVAGLSLRSRPQFSLIEGIVKWRGAAEQGGADSPLPPAFQKFHSGVSADVHLSSLMTNLTRGYLQSPDTQEVRNLMIVTHKIAPDAPPTEGIKVSRNVDWETFSKAVDTARAANDPKVAAIRVKRPGRSPEFSADKAGNLVAIVHDLAVEVPVPAAAAKSGLFAGPPARIYRLEAPSAEISISFKITPASDVIPVKLSGRVESFEPGPGAKVFAINEDETKASELSVFTSRIIFGVLGTRLHGQPVDVPLGMINLPGYELDSVSALHPTGWIRVVLTPKP